METRSTIMVMMFLVALLVLNKYRSLYGVSVCAAIGGAAYLLLSHLDEIEGFAPLLSEENDSVSGTPSAAASSAASVSDNTPTPTPKSFKNKVEDLLPVETELWEGAVPPITDDDGNKVSPVKANLMNMPSSFMGMVLQSNKIANHDLRCAPYIKKSNIAPWMMSTVEADTRRRGAQIVSCEAAEAEAEQF